MSDITSGIFSYDGDMATNHRLSARDLGPALVGLDAIVSSLFKMLETRAVQRKKPREASLILTVKEPRAGSFELAWIAQTAPALLPLWPHFTDAIQSKLVEHFVNYVMLWFGGRRREADNHMDKMLDLLAAESERQHEDRQREREAIYADAQRQREHIRQLLHDQALALHGQAKLAVAPVGRSATMFRTGAGGGDQPSIDEATADAIRAKDEVEVSEVMEMTFRIDGMSDRRRTMSVYDPEDEEGGRIISAVISDPAFDMVGNIYKRAYFDGAPITLTGKATRFMDGRLKTFHAMDARL